MKRPCSIGVQRAEYNEITLFDKLEETNPCHKFSVDLDQEVHTPVP